MDTPKVSRYLCRVCSDAGLVKRVDRKSGQFVRDPVTHEFLHDDCPACSGPDYDDNAGERYWAQREADLQKEHEEIVAEWDRAKY